MTLGRTPEGAIKIKTDNGTTRAVNCACCSVACGCGAISIPEPLRTVLVDATSVTIDGFPSSSNSPYGFGWISFGNIYYLDPILGYVDNSYYIEFNGICLYGSLFFYNDLEGTSLAYFGEADQCGDSETVTQAGTFTINGEVFNYFTYIGEDPPAPMVPPPNMTVT